MLKHVITRDALFQFCFNVSILFQCFNFGEARRGESATSIRNFVKIDAREGCLRVRLFCMVWCEEEEEDE